MRKYLLIVPAVALTACVETNEGTVAGATVGGIAGAALADDGDRFEGAALGAGVGAVAGTLLGRSQQRPDECVYQDAYGQRYVAACP